ncbi:hypothetical protein Tco_0558253 [Tanacetum coccineum]
MASHRSKSLYAIKECSTCGRLSTKECCSIGSLKDKILVPEPDSSPRCARCGTQVDGLSYHGCAFLRKTFDEDLLAYCVENFQDTSESSNDNTNVVNALREPCVVNQDPDSDDDDFEDIEYVSLEEVNEVDQEEKEFDLEDILLSKTLSFVRNCSQPMLQPSKRSRKLPKSKYVCYILFGKARLAMLLASKGLKVRIYQKSQENSQKRASTDTRIRRVQKEAKESKPKPEKSSLSQIQVKSVNHEAITSLLSSINHVSNGESTRGVGFCAKLTHKTSTNVTSKNDMLAILRCPQFDQTATIEAQMIEEMIG